MEREEINRRGCVEGREAGEFGGGEKKYEKGGWKREKVCEETANVGSVKQER